ncbi:hypothetical protein NE237_016245 [Protea cynaroides]|uniref:Hyaluronan/mRNA-binding protein domain-containing protein n=1 Tax=Protea cynaroides TaxID=273540 RepID=A0A9Q0KFL0_9MAGN|nr:hypothetical protein NE237_016245 [Protea cynaroides]
MQVIGTKESRAEHLVGPLTSGCAHGLTVLPYNYAFRASRFEAFLFILCNNSSYRRCPQRCSSLSDGKKAKYLMAGQGNSFALLLDEEGDDVTILVANVAAKVAYSPPAEKKQQPQQKNQQPASASLVKGSEYVRAERGGRGRGGRGLGSGGDVGGQFGSGRVNGYQRNYGDIDGFAVDDSTRGRGGRGRGRGGRGRGRGGINEDRGFGNEGQQGFGGIENQGQGGGAGNGWEEAGDSQGRPFRNESRQFRNDYRNGDGERRGYGGGERRRNYGDRDGARYSRGEEGQNSSEKKEEQFDSKDQTENNGKSNNGGEWGAPENTEVPKDAEPEQGKPEQVASQDMAEKKSPVEEEDNNMTLDEYEKLLSEKRKALEALKTEERKVTLDKDLQLMQLVEKKKEGTLFIKLSEKDKLKKKDSLEKEDKVRKLQSFNINEFLGDKYVGMTGRGRARGRGRGGFRGPQGREAISAPCIEDPRQFPVLGGAAVKV